MDNRPCKITSISGRGPIEIIGDDIFTGLKHQRSYMSIENLGVPTIERIGWYVYRVTDDGFLVLKKFTDTEKTNVKLPPGDLEKRLKARLDGGEIPKVKVMSALGEQGIEDWDLPIYISAHVFLG